jgi:hypothetical protein
VTTRNNHETRDGLFLQPTLTKAMAAKMAPDTAFNATFAGTMYASPLFLANGPGGKGIFIAATTSNDVYALDETTGATVWMRNIGAAPSASGAGCGNVSPVGIIGTPVIDAATGTIYVAGGVGSTSIQRHEIHALDALTGAERAGWPISAATIKAGDVELLPQPQNQRAALSLVGGTLYVAYGGHAGDCGEYKGWVMAINTATPTQRGAWATSGVGEAIWHTGGMASNGDGVFAVTGNNTRAVATHADSEEVVHLTGLAQLNRATGIYYPSHWRKMDQDDSDFGSVNPVYITVGATGYIAAAAKDGHFYLLNPANLGGMAGHVADFMIANDGAMAVKTAPAAYTSGTGVHVVMNASGASCATGAGNVVSVRIAPGPVVTSEWCAQGTEATPIATSTNGSAETVVWFMNGAQLKGVDGDTGATIYAGGNCTNVRKWTSPIAVGGRIITGSDGKLCSWSPH